MGWVVGGLGDLIDDVGGCVALRALAGPFWGSLLVSGMGAFLPPAAIAACDDVKRDEYDMLLLVIT